MSTGELVGAAVPDLAGEFAETLSVYWRKERSSYTTEGVPSEMLYMLLDSLASVVLGVEE